MPKAETPRPGLRERKKLKTRAAIQEHALRLFGEQGYEATTVQQIAEAAEASPSTFFRYFPTKEDVVLYDSFDPAIIEAIRAQPMDVSPLSAIRAGLRSAFAHAPPGEIARQNERGALILSVPELRMRMLDELLRTATLFSEVIAERVGRQPDDMAVRALIGSVIGVGVVTWLTGPHELPDEYLALFEQGLASLEAGFPL